MADIDTIRTPGNWSDVFLILDEPPTVYTARATGPINQTTWTIGFDGGSGTLADCLVDMTLLIGSSAGAADVGAARLRKAPISGTFYIGADPSLVVEDNDFLTVVNDFGLFARHPVGLNMDVDVVYSDQFSNFDPIPWFDGRVAVIKAGGTAIFDATQSWAPGSTISAYAWAFPGASSYTDETTATPSATYNVSGRYRVALTIGAANGKSCTGYGWVYVRGENLTEYTDLVEEVEIGEEGGSFRVQMMDRPTIRDGTRVVLIAEDHFNGSEQSFGFLAGRENILMVGWILGESIVRTAPAETVEFAVGGPLRALGELAALEAGLFDKTLPEDEGVDLPAWSKLSSLTVAKGLHYLARQRSTISRVLDFYVEDWGYACPKLEGNSNQLGAQLTEYAERAALTVRADRIGGVWCERDAQLYPIDDRTANIPVVASITDDDWQDELSILRRQIGEVSWAQAEGEIFTGGKLIKVGGRSPGNQPARWGGSEDLQDLYLSTQGDALELAGLLAGWKNAEIESVLMRGVYNNRLMDVTPRQYLQVTVDGETLRCIPRRITFRQEAGSGYWHTDLELEPEGGQWPAIPITYPGDGEPPIEPPVEPPEPPFPPDEGEEEEPSDTDAVVTTSSDVRTSTDLTEASPAWATEL